ncbi:MAG: 2Fe-2S iron-sulfur cluster binding domain-containing protein [Alphaproteobacteria bacterium]|nr:2Fe-2S iron-sulfur cluster binding domain-containing protein [Alphaproteobacteria bacterium]MBU0875884.1 2Fe-2S iron-sulfur cluster binding domain-containing protein [Alphaproteobacteria bacterium]MBU1769935.1 2Fe-2S iron-sulfur cluster binding domain-containing protein [Alphaproteobacteria bacterium]
MTKIRVRLRSGEEKDIAAQEDRSLMEALRDGGVEELLALCGGCCSCATCHVILEPGVFDALDSMNVDEDDLLDSSSHRRATSRLSCQVPVNALPDGAIITVAPED